ncbi:uncharacterized protein LOC132760581 isoform X4 [Ruditapes philippinarum]|uniref:uncharacterized protein LOC132760581 isoform X4 n=1 Tax=Ruditapes philippinarum TaxID=129788 RepID=UPI00295C340D|nr:uncharacterized protein LOC132760581 isoform X4 [Ruditapes philippinarum]
MKLFTLLIILPALAMAVPEKRFIETITSLIDTPTLKLHLQQLIDIIGSDATEGACEKAAHTVFSGLLDHSVPLICHSLQELIHHFHIVPSTSSVKRLAVVPEKRFLIDQLTQLIDTTTLKDHLQQLLDIIGSDATEGACEKAAHAIFSGLLDHSVPLICHSFQELVHHFQIVPSTSSVKRLAVVPEKRYLLDQLTSLIDTPTLKIHLQQLLDIIGSDATEGACEKAAHAVFSGLLDHSVPLICHGFQELIHHFQIVPSTSSVKRLAIVPEKRYLLDQITTLIDTPTLKTHLQQLLDIIGSDATEGACEKAAHAVFSGLLDHSVPLICHGFQELVHHFQIVPSTSSVKRLAVVPEKRYLLDQITTLIDTPTLKTHLQQLLDIIGSDATEGACEKAAHAVFSGLLDHSVPLICHGFQELVHHFQIVPSTSSVKRLAVVPEKRYLLDQITPLIDTPTLKLHLQQLLDIIGSDATEGACEKHAHAVFSGILDHSVPLICHGFQELVHHFQIVQVTTTTTTATR